MRFALWLALACRPRSVPPDYTPLVLEPATPAEQRATVERVLAEIAADRDAVAGMRHRDPRCVHALVDVIETSRGEATAAAERFALADVRGDRAAADAEVHRVGLALARARTAAADANGCPWQDPTPAVGDPLRDPLGRPDP